MINVKKIVAVALAATMCLGVSVTAFADDLPNQDNTAARGEDAGSANNGLQLEAFDRLDSPFDVLDQTNVTGGTANRQGVRVNTTNGDGEFNAQLTLKNGGINAGSTAWNSVNSQEEIADILSKNGLSVPSGTRVMVLADAVVNGLSDEQRNVLTFTLPGTEFTTDPYDQTKYHQGDNVWAMIETGNNTGVWEMRSGVVNASGQVDFEVNHTGAVILIKTMKNGRIVAVEKDSQGNVVKPPVVVDPSDNNNTTPVKPDDKNSQGTSQTPSAGSNASSSLGTSPKTGEF